MTAAVVIPARFGSTRFPAKIVASQTGRPLVQHVVDQVKFCRKVARCVVATDDQRIVDALAPFGTETVLTSPDHQSGTDRVAEVARRLLSDVDVVVNVQGDEPEIEPDTVDRLIVAMQESEADMATAATPFSPSADPNDPNLVKVVLSAAGNAIYFSRSRIPYPRDAASQGNVGFLLHLGIYAYRRRFLLEFASWRPTPLELTEKLEQLRAIEHGRSIRVITVSRATHGIDTAEQYESFVSRYKSTRSVASRELPAVDSAGAGRP